MENERIDTAHIFSTKGYERVITGCSTMQDLYYLTITCYSHLKLPQIYLGVDSLK